jgi:hypothetical protein
MKWWKIDRSSVREKRIAELDEKTHIHDEKAV